MNGGERVKELTDTRDLAALCLELRGNPISSIFSDLSFNNKSGVTVLDKNLRAFYNLWDCVASTFALSLDTIFITGF